ncbi:MAG: hypothetical protein M0P94_04275 [Candidatus Absconditabacterales bacterium]|nr:hypothetical protein [Candidatus Absconditabacterales bacterium]
MLEEAGRIEGMNRPMTAVEFQNMKLGVWKAEQFRRGKVDIRGLISPRTKDGTPLVYTIDEMKKKYNIKDYKDYGIIISNKQFGKKSGKHAKAFGLNPKNKTDRSEFKSIISDVIDNKNEIREGVWRDGKEVIYYIKSNDVVVIEKESKEFVTILKGGVKNERIKNARKRK